MTFGPREALYAFIDYATQGYLAIVALLMLRSTARPFRSGPGSSPRTRPVSDRCTS